MESVRKGVIGLQLVIFLATLTVLSSAAVNGPVLDPNDECVCACERVTAETCKAEYKRTVFPNKINAFSTQKEAVEVFKSFPTDVLTLQTCSSMLITFLCSYYFPPCANNFSCEGVGPCDSLCYQVRASCEPLLLQHNYTWPDHLNCSKFPTSNSADPYCIPGVLPQDISLKQSCEKLEQPICASLHSNYLTLFPNKDLITQRDADLQFNSYLPFLTSNCSPLLKVLLCTSHYPICTAGKSHIQIYPCKDMCEQVRQSCEPSLLKYNASWPEFLDCDNFPSKTQNICADSMFAAPNKPTTITPTPTTSGPTTSIFSTSALKHSTSTSKPTTSPPATTQKKCEPLIPEVLEICGDIHPDYVMTHFPYGPFKCQRQAIETLKNSTEFLKYLQLVNQNCAAELKPFLCLHYFPMCSHDKGSMMIKNPCRSICRKATTGCSNCVNEWPFNCDDYKVKGTCLGLSDLKRYLRMLTTKESKC